MVRHRRPQSLLPSLASTLLYPTTLFAHNPFKLANAEIAKEAKKILPDAIGAFLYGPGHIVIPYIVERGHRGPCHASTEGGRGGST